MKYNTQEEHNFEDMFGFNNTPEPGMRLTN